ncbi:hypothetical protein [Sulfurimonas sp. HSL3-7]|uniref:hypothetical protein n=1 Tax=Sulfonitrofixus jiaomeiensis TaxID=3131938 RepID=UPI0031F9A6B7
MEFRSWAIKIANREVLDRLMEMVEKQEIEEMFLCQIDADDAVIKGSRKGEVIGILLIKGVKIRPRLESLGQSVLLDDLDDDMFDIDDEGAALRGVIYPESEEDELQMIERLA